MKAPDEADTICDEIAGELREIGGWLAAGKLDPEQFRQSVLTLEAAKVARYGFKLSGENTSEGRTRFSLRFADTGGLCTTLEFDPATGELARQ